MKAFFVAILILFPKGIFAQQQNWVAKSSAGLIARGAHTSCAVGDKIYVIGGSSEGTVPNIDSHNYIQIYDPLSDTWTTPQTIGNFALRSDATLSVVDGKIYIIGGAYNSNITPRLPS